MPLRTLRRTDPQATHPELLDELIAEWRKPSDDDSKPIIIEDGIDHKHRPIHLYVIWEKWTPLNQRERSEIITDAFEAVKEKELAVRVTVAMGLTADEAKRMGIHYR
jgi:hypothetical protein